MESFGIGHFVSAAIQACLILGIICFVVAVVLSSAMIYFDKNKGLSITIIVSSIVAGMCNVPTKPKRLHHFRLALLSGVGLGLWAGFIGKATKGSTDSLTVFGYAFTIGGCIFAILSGIFQIFHFVTRVKNQ